MGIPGKPINTFIGSKPNEKAVVGIFKQTSLDKKDRAKASEILRSNLSTHFLNIINAASITIFKINERPSPFSPKLKSKPILKSRHGTS